MCGGGGGGMGEGWGGGNTYAVIKLLQGENITKEEENKKYKSWALNTPLHV